MSTGRGALWQVRAFRQQSQKRDLKILAQMNWLYRTAQVDGAQKIHPDEQLHESLQSRVNNVVFALILHGHPTSEAKILSLFFDPSHHVLSS